MSKTVHTSPISPPPGQKDQSARLAASAKVDQVEGTTSQSILKSSSRALPAGDLSGISVHRNPGGAGGAWGDGAAGSLNRASEIPSLTPALIAEYSTQYVSSIPMAAAMNGNSSPNPINPTAASPSLEATDLKTASAKESAWSEFKQVAGMMVKSRVFWSLLPFNLALFLIAKWQELLTWWAKGTPFSVVEDWADFLGFVFVYSLGNLVDGLRSFFQAVCS